MRKFLIALGAAFLLLILAAIAIPLFVDVDKYRPQIEQAVNDRINGRLQLGKLKLSLWGQIRVQVDGVKLSDSRGGEVLAVNDAYVHLPFASVFSGSPSMVLMMRKPVLHVTRDKNGKMNLMSLMKPSAEQATAPAPGQPAPKAESKPVALPAMATQARFSMEMRDAQVTYQDASMDLNTEVNDLNLLVKDISLSRPTEIELWADLDTKMGKSLTVRGPARLNATAKTAIEGSKLSSFSLTAKANLDGLDIQQGDLFHKKAGMAANADLALTANDKEARIEHLDLRFFNADVKSSGVISNLGASPTVQYSLKSNAIDLKPWNELIPMMSDYELAGNAELSANVQGPTEKIAYGALMKVNALTAKAPKLKTRPRFDATIKVATDQIEDMVLTMKAPGNDLLIKGKMQSFTAPKLALDITSQSLDLDQLIEFPPMGSSKKTESAAAAPQAAPATGGAKAPAAGAPASDYDALLEPMREMKMMKAFVANLGVNMKLIKAYNVRITDITGRASMKDLAASVESLGLKVFGGSAKASFYTDMKPKAPTYRFGMNVANLAMEQAVESQLHLFKNTFLGKAGMELTGEGASYNPTPAMQNLKAKGKVRIDQATFATIDVSRMTTEALNQAIGRIAEKLPQLKGKQVGSLGSGGSKYQYIASSVVIDGGKFSMPDLVAKAEPNQGIDLKGTMTVGMIDYKMDAAFQIIDTYNLTGARNLSAPLPGGGTVEHVLAEGNGPVTFTQRVGGTAFNPTYSYAEVPQQLATVALSNVAKATGDRAAAELRKKAEQIVPKEVQKAIPQQIPQGVQDAAKKLFGG